MKKVLLTGASGFVGKRTIAPFLAKGFEVHAVSLTRKLGDLPEGVFEHCLDLFDGNAVRALLAELAPSHLLHLAWYAEPKKYQHSPENYRWVRASLDLLEAFALAGGRRVVMAGTCAEYDWGYGYCTEALTPLNPSSPYGICKYALSSLVPSYCRTQGLSSAWGRLFFLYGPGEYPERLVSSVITSLLRGEEARCTHGRQLRDFLYVDDVASAFVALLDSEVEGAVNIASGRPVALREIIYAAADIVGARHMVALGALPVSPSDPPLLVANCKRLAAEVGWIPRYDLVEGLMETVDYWKRHVGHERP
ncbi:NAD-dependent epimerase/dehydratase family protein [Thiovibrio sp. JS02]